MAAVKELASFTVQRKGENYRITLEDENGDTIEYTADYVALDQVSEAVDGALESDDDEEIEFEEDDDDGESGLTRALHPCPRMERRYTNPLI